MSAKNTADASPPAGSSPAAGLDLSGDNIFQTVFQASLAIMYLLDPHTGVILDANPAASAFYGIPRAELRGLPLAGLSTLTMRKIKTILAEIRKNGSGHLLSRHRLKNGELRDVELHATPMALADGRECIFIIVHDIAARIQAERNLRERESLLRAILDSAGDGIGFKDRAHIYREANPAFCQLLGRNCKDVLGHKSADFSDRRRNAKYIDESDNEVMRTRQSVIYESNYTCPEGTRTLSVNKAPVLDGQGDCLGVVFIAHDITEQRVAEAALRQSEGLLRAMLQSAQDAIYITDSLGLLSEINPAFCELVDKPREALLGQPLTAAFEPEELNIQQSTRQLALDTQGPVNFTQRIKRPGRDSWINVVKTPVIDDQGYCLGVVSMGRDITAQKTGEIALRESERRFSVLVHQSPVGVFETDAKGKLTFANDRMLRLTGRPLEQLLGTDWLASIHPEERQEFTRDWHAALSARREFSTEVRLRTPRGTLTWVTTLMRPMRDNASRIVGYLGAVSDISERKKAENMREDVEKVIRHDLKSPLSAIGNAAELLEMLGPLNAEQTHVLEELRSLSKRMYGLINLSLDLRAMETGRYTLEPESFDLGAALEALRAELRPLTDGKELSLRMKVEGRGPLLVLGERRLVDTVFVNLLKNAAEASPEGADILVRLKAQKGFAVATLRNSGEVPLDIRERFFEKYATSGKLHGTGLGTYSARLMVRALNGSIELDTSEPGATTLVVRLPLAEQTQQANQADQAGPAA
ncbi:MAG: PAS domain S-box protein [Proteobacteria bacterium]|nr:PAS domain S-box protein [Pseudomonadota bacterium]